MIKTVGKILANSARKYSDRIALGRCSLNKADTYTYERLICEVYALRKWLQSRNITKGSPVALLCENIPQWAVAYFAVLSEGAVLVPIDPLGKPPEISSIIKQSRCQMLIYSQQYTTLAQQSADGGNVEAVKLEPTLGQIDIPEHMDRDMILCIENSSVNPEDLAVLSFTSGTTGISKGIMLSHLNIASDAQMAYKRVGATCEDSMLSILPLNHMFEQTAGLLLPIFVGGRVWYPCTKNPRQIMGAMKIAKPTILLVVPAIARLFKKNIESKITSLSAPSRMIWSLMRWASKMSRKMGVDISGKIFHKSVGLAFGGKLRFMISGGAALEDQTAEFFFDLGISTLQGYGLSETSPIASSNSIQNHRLGSVGRTLDGVEAKIITTEGCSAYEGELWLKGPNIMMGYYNNPQANAEVFDGEWFKTGDLARIDDDGYIYITGRLKDVIIGESGKNIYPGEIEAHIVQSSYVKDVCVLGIVKTKSTEEVAALVLPNSELLGTYTSQHDDILREEIKKACINLADYKRPKHLAIWQNEDFPKTTTMKIKKHEVRKSLATLNIIPL